MIIKSIYEGEILKRFSAITLFVLCGQWAFGISTNFSEQLKDLSCASKIKDKVGLRLARQTWYPKTVSVPGLHLIAGIAFRDTRTQTAYKIWSENKKTFFLDSDLKTLKETLTIWNSEKACEVKSLQRAVELPSSPSNVKSKTLFTDSDLFKVMSSHPWGVIYLWTPYMPLSVMGLKEIKKAVQSKGGHLTVLLDDKADLEQAKKWVVKNEVAESELVQVAANELFEREVGVHYPTALIYKDKFLSNRNYVGHKYSDVYKKWIDLELADLEKDMK